MNLFLNPVIVALLVVSQGAVVICLSRRPKHRLAP
ncbi:hypothetical protein SAMN05216178_5228 [Pseudomonas saponiphila]|uniref:Uncharacterized protein n=1 Tax=Pseudomonas saponiphila TaxID=556534 RepID=A0A1H4W3M5_9PSED|nr:hypothetical protein SAMN05216178_5228 [Pseudomonas saponiphila]